MPKGWPNYPLGFFPFFIFLFFLFLDLILKKINILIGQNGVF